jgi:hypothetical protein
MNGFVERLGRGRSTALVVLVAALAAVPASAAADTLTVNFETGPAVGTAVTDDYLGSAFVRFLAADRAFARTAARRRARLARARSSPTSAPTTAFPRAAPAPTASSSPAARPAG